MAEPTAIQAWDEVFVRCPRYAANALLTDPLTWAAWWPGCAVTATGDQEFDVALRSMWPVPTRQSVRLTVTRIRHGDKGMNFRVAGDVEGTGEWFHVDQPNGVVVNYLLRAECHRPLPRLWLAAHRGIVRAGLTSLKHRLEGGRAPGAEPDPDLLAHQTDELATFAREVAEYEVEKAAAAKAAKDAAPGGGADALS